MTHVFANEIDVNSDVITLDALRGIQAGKIFYVAMCSLGMIPTLFKLNEAEIPAELRAQRKLQESRIPEITNYIVNNTEEYVFSSLTTSVDGKMDFHPAPSVGEKGKIGRLNISLNCKILINDGQHRRAAIEKALKIRPELANEMIPVVFFQDKGLVRSQQLFSDLNKHAVKPTKSLGILYDHRDLFSQFIVKLANGVEIFQGRVELERTSIPTRSAKFFTLNGIADATKQFLKSTSKSKKISEEKQKLAIEFWTEISENIPEWQLLSEKKDWQFKLKITQ